MDINRLALFTATEAALSLSPGPAVMMVVAYGIARGWRTSLFVNLGILSGNAIYFALSATGLGSLLLASPRLFAGIKYLGAAYLIYLGLSAIFGKASPITLSRLSNTPQSAWQIYRNTLMMQLSNPKAMLTFLALLPQFVDTHQSVGWQMLILAMCSIVPEFFILLGYGLLASRASQYATRPDFATITERIAGTLVMLAAVMVAVV